METELSRWQLAYETVSTLMTSVTSSRSDADWRPLLLSYPIDANEMYVPLLRNNNNGTFVVGRQSSANRRVVDATLRGGGDGQELENTSRYRRAAVQSDPRRATDAGGGRVCASNGRHATTLSDQSRSPSRPTDSDRHPRRSRPVVPVPVVVDPDRHENDSAIRSPWPLSRSNSAAKTTDDISGNGDRQQRDVREADSRSRFLEANVSSEDGAESADALFSASSLSRNDDISPSNPATNDVCHLFQRLMKNFYTETFLWIYVNTLLHPGSRRILNRIHFLALETGRTLQQAVYDMLTGFLNGYQHSRIPLLTEIDRSLRLLSAVHSFRQRRPPHATNPPPPLTGDDVDRGVHLRRLSLELGAALNPRQMLRSFGTVVREVTMHTIASPGVQGRRFCQQIHGQNSQMFSRHSFASVNSTNDSERDSHFHRSASNLDCPWQLIPPPPPPYPGFLLHFLAMLDQPTLPSDVPEYFDVDNPEDSYEALSEFAEQLGDAKVGLADDDIQRIPVYQFNLTDQMSFSTQDTCVICIGSYETGQQLRLLPCGHDFHDICIDKWLKVSNSCPVCRSHLSFGA